MHRLEGGRNLGNLNVCPREQEGRHGGSDCSGVTGCILHG